jgi:hypothetical protein
MTIPQNGVVLILPNEKLTDSPEASADNTKTL